MSASIDLSPGRSGLSRVLIAARRQNRPDGPVPSLNNQTAVITGSSSGYGLACAKLLPGLGVSHLILGVRSIKRGEEAIKQLRKDNVNITFEVWELDMLSYDSVRNFAQRLKSLHRLDLAILNAGVVKLDFAKSPEPYSHEETIKVNYLSTALLTILLLPILKPKNALAPPGRLTIVGSSTAVGSDFEHRAADPLLPALDREWAGAFAGSEQYAVSKLLVMMFVFKLSQLVSPDHVIINNVCPGLSNDTNLSRQAKGVLKLVAMGMQKAYGRTTEQG